MDEKPEEPSAREPDLAAALRRARVENAERADAVAELREIEAGRLALLESALQKVVRQAPPGVDLFDLTLAQGERPRVFLDMVAFIEMARDRRTYRFFQDTVYGRVLIAESPKIDTIVAACTNYVARRLIERERALTSDAPRPPDPPGIEPARPRPLGTPRPAPTAALTPRATAERGLGRGLAAFFTYLLMAIGAAALVAGLAILVTFGRDHRLGELWALVQALKPQ